MQLFYLEKNKLCRSFNGNWHEEKKISKGTDPKKDNIHSNEDTVMCFRGRASPSIYRQYNSGYTQLSLLLHLSRACMFILKGGEE